MPRLGIIAGGGALPKKLVEACRLQQRDYFVLGFKGQTDESLSPHAWSRLGATDAAVKILKENNVDTLVMAGAIRRPTLSELKPDWRTVQVFARLGPRALGDDALLRAVASEMEKDGFKVVGAHEIDPSLITPPGVLGKVSPSSEQRADIETGVRAAKALGALDIGQGAVVQQGIVLGVEAVEGTDALISRCKPLRRKGRGGVLVKCCKPGQDRRVDLPTVGPRTVIRCFEAGIEGIAVEAGASVILDREETCAAADKLGMFVVGF
jgi:DUF1009 family protein